jgi:hypothetical protein
LIFLKYIYSVLDPTIDKYLAMSTHTMRPTLQTVPESLPADHVTQPNQTPVTSSVTTANPIVVSTDKNHQSTQLTQSGQSPAVTLKPRSSSSRVSIFNKFKMLAMFHDKCGNISVIVSL